MKYGIKFDRPSNRYDEALMVGNGRLGAMVSGAVVEKQIWVNEETVWYGGPRDRNNPDAINYIGEIKRLVAEDKIKEAERLAVLTLTGVPESQRHYSTLGMIVLSMDNHEGEVTNYSNILDFESATVETRYTVNDADYCMNVFCSSPDNTVVIKLKCNKRRLSFFAGIERGERVNQFSYGTHEDDSLRDMRGGVMMTGNCGGKNGLDFAGAMFGSCDGTLRNLGDKIVIEDATTATLVFTAKTNYLNRDENILENVTNHCYHTLNKGYEDLYRVHLNEWQPLYDKITIKLDSIEKFTAPSMNRLFEAFKSKDYSIIGCDNSESFYLLEDYLSMLLFHFGRYALLSAARKCLIPASLQGVWCRDLLSIWDGKYTTNINLQMMYWPVDSCGLESCFRPYLDFAKKIRENGMVTAKKMYGCRGFVLHNNTDIWADTAVQDSGTHCSYWFIGGVWIACDLYEHYRYTLDLEYLKEAWPIIRDAALFIIDYMDEDGDKLVMGATSSPENFYVADNGDKVSFCKMTAMDSEMIELLLDDCIEAYHILSDKFGSVEAEDKLIDELKSARQRIYPTVIGKDGCILEWGKEVVAEAEPMHRHLSHLLGAYPYNNISPKTPELFKSVSKSLDKRIKNGGCNTGWGRAWGAGIMARLGRGDEAFEMVNSMLRLSGQPNLMSCCNIGKTPKLMENNMPMQLDGTLGSVQAIAEMLLQSFDDEIILLPALPTKWRNGSFQGLLARKNILVDAEWSDGELVKATLTANKPTDITVRYKTDIKSCNTLSDIYNGNCIKAKLNENEQLVIVKA